jgi:hypothetical protein
MAKATIKQVRDYFAADGGTPLKMDELKEFKASNGGRDYDQVAEGIGDGTLTY